MQLRVILVIVIVIGLVLVGICNGLVTRRNRVEEALGQIQVQLKRRHDPIPNVVNAVKGYVGFEQNGLTAVTEARANAVAAGARGPHEQVMAENALTGAPRSLPRRPMESRGDQRTVSAHASDARPDERSPSCCSCAPDALRARHTNLGVGRRRRDEQPVLVASRVAVTMRSSRTRTSANRLPAISAVSSPRLR